MDQDDPVHAKLDVLTYSLMDEREDNKAYHQRALRTQWVICAIIVLAILVAAIFS
ncbi:hypothetical protein ACE102_33860 [Bradyrhizobium sp. vgs-9]|uniref:hypothetical protein n=1 Tax=Bradyrhizobium sp. vgs-9 TaxID=208389 RepID=UPI0035D4F7D4